MSATMDRTPVIGLSDDELKQMLALAGGADSVELKLTVPDAHHRSTIAALGMDPLDAQIRLVSFFDTPELALNQHGLVVRARRVKGREDDSVVKLRPVVPDEVPDHLMGSEHFYPEEGPVRRVEVEGFWIDSRRQSSERASALCTKAREGRLGGLNQPLSQLERYERATAPMATNRHARARRD